MVFQGWEGQQPRLSFWVSYSGRVFIQSPPLPHPPLGAAPLWARRPAGSAVPKPISGLQARAYRWGQAVEEPARVHHVGNVPAETLPYPGKVDLGRPRLEWGWGADASSDAMAPQPFQDTPWEFRAGGAGWG